MNPANSRAGPAPSGYTAAMRRTTALFQPLLPGLVFAAGRRLCGRARRRLPRLRPRHRSGPARTGRQARAERRMLKADGHEFAVFVRAARTPATRGTLLLIPGDGSHPTSAAGLEQIRQAMPAHRLGDVAADAGTATALPCGENRRSPRLAARDRGSGTRQRGAGNARRSARGRTGAMGGAQPGAHHRRDSLRRGRGAPAGAGGRGQLRRPAHPRHGQRARRGAGRGAAGSRGIPGLALEWPKGLARPVMEVLSPAASHAQGRLRREQAATRQLENYRQLTLETGRLATRRSRCAADAPPARLADYAGPDSRRCCRRPLSSA